MRCYSELIQLKTFEERFEYLKDNGIVGDMTFGHNRLLNQRFYNSIEWRRVRDEVVIRDNACDLAHSDYPISGRIIVHHMNPIVPEDLIDFSSKILNPEFLICVSHDTHNAITYGSDNPRKVVTERTPFDTCPWRKR